MKSNRAARTSAGIDDAVPRGCTNFKLRQLTRRVSQHFDRIVAGAGLKTTQYSLLSNIVRLGPIRPGDLARELGMEASTMTRNLQPLVAQGWITVGPGDDGRSRCVEATESGRAKRVEAQREWKRAQLAFNKRLGDANVARLHAMIEECMAHLTDEEPEADAGD
jgi:DNA-binding MarR family transcriptional regulator